LWQLNPRNQFLPPRLSIFEVQTQLSEIAKHIGNDRREEATMEAGVGAILGHLIAPGIGPVIVGAAIAAFHGLFAGKKLLAMQTEVDQQITHEIDFGLNQLDDRILAWIARQKAQYTKAATESWYMKLISRPKSLR